MSLIDIGKLADPATKLIEKVSDAVGGIAKPWQITRIAKAESKAALIKARTDIEITDLQNRALRRLVNEEAEKQKNIESITYGATKYLTDQSRPEDIDPDWITYAFERCRYVSDEGIQIIWSRILASEANDPGNISKLSLDVLAKMDANSANKFLRLTEYIFEFDDGTRPHYSVIFYKSRTFYQNCISFSDLSLLEELGLIRMQVPTLHDSPYAVVTEIRHPKCRYGSKVLEITTNQQFSVNVGSIILTAAGNSILRAIDRSVNIEVFEEVIRAWIELGYEPRELLQH